MTSFFASYSYFFLQAIGALVILPVSIFHTMANFPETPVWQIVLLSLLYEVIAFATQFLVLYVLKFLGKLLTMKSNDTSFINRMTNNNILLHIGLHIIIIIINTIRMYMFFGSSIFFYGFLLTLQLYYIYAFITHIAELFGYENKFLVSTHGAEGTFVMQFVIISVFANAYYSDVLTHYGIIFPLHLIFLELWPFVSDSFLEKGGIYTIRSLFFINNNFGDVITMIILTFIQYLMIVLFQYSKQSVPDYVVLILVLGFLVNIILVITSCHIARKGTIQNDDTSKRYQINLISVKEINNSVPQQEPIVM
ncbi:hypothetical protein YASMINEVIRUS_1610 [Yasminevirus sp. GU-2018]|uniref:Uncharacterized protein n=1 Tax=Yasminevirus sp. GU-2018 TaxID=2420051 RepID=A0A5K0UAM4_9VIRU|nr:hypothetical protein YASMINEVIRUS_1610 [Yasminevirus sp. GU-2018]